MIDRERLEEVRGRLAELRIARGRGEVDGELAAAVADDLEWLVERAEVLADDNRRLAKLVAEITDMVRDARRRRIVPVADSIDDALGRDRDEEE